MDASHTVAWMAGVGMGSTVMYFVLWYQARKIAALVPGGLKAWDEYNMHADHQSPTGRTVTADE